MRIIKCVAFVLLLLPVTVFAADEPFHLWLKDFKKEALASGISESTLTAAFQGVKPSEGVLKLDRAQPESTVTFAQYLKTVVSRSRIENGRENYLENEKLLLEISKKYNVPASVVVALWGVETSYGNNMGDNSIIESLATLAFDGRRSAFFRKELLAALKILDDDHIDAEDFTGSWAGALGQCQFMPSSFLNYAVDYDGDGKRDIWNNKKDVFASIANYLHEFGWDDSKEWGYSVNLPSDANNQTWARENTQMVWEKWLKLGVTLNARKIKLDGSLPLTLIYPDDELEHPYLVTSNFDVIMKWNRSQYFAASVGTLAYAIE